MEEEIKPKPKITETDVLDALMSVGGYLKAKGLRKIEMTIDNNSRLKIEVDTDWLCEMNDRFSESFGRGRY